MWEDGFRRKGHSPGFVVFGAQGVLHGNSDGEVDLKGAIQKEKVTVQGVERVQEDDERSCADIYDLWR